MAVSAERPAPPSPDLPGVEQLRALAAILRGPGGCPWDREQTHATVRGDLLEEAYEVVAAIDSQDEANLREELGDLLLQVVFHCQLAEEEGRFTLDEVAREVTAKLIRRHPHVFGNEELNQTGAVLRRWEEIKREEKGLAAAASVLDGLTPGMPALLHAEKVQKKASKVGFDWNEPLPVLEKIREELAEVEAALAAGQPAALEEEIGDLLFATVNLARKLKITEEIALHGATTKFARRFRQVEALARGRGQSLPQMTLAEMDLLWDEVKRSQQRK